MAYLYLATLEPSYGCEYERAFATVLARAQVSWTALAYI